MQEITTTRTNQYIDPVLHIWHSEIPLYLFLGGIVAGIMILSGLWHLLRPADERSRALSMLPWASPVLLSAGMFFLWLDLEHPFNAWRFYLSFKLGSPMSWGAWILLLIYPASILLAWVGSPADVRQGCIKRLARFPSFDRWSSWSEARVKPLAAANVILGAALGIYTGVLLGTMAARPLWNSAILGPLFLVSGLSTGAAFLLLYRLADKERVALSKIDMGLIVVELLLITLWFIGLASGGAAARAAVWQFFGGPYTAAFWTLVIALGLVTPLVAEIIEHRHKVVPGRVTAVLVLIGGFALRWIVVFAGQHSGWVSELAQR
ncbi:MAG: polysulfide reductase NrfD [Gemmatimonadota bacterium]|nr:MAG: polysulfide reductase NrfD [Gemmatimonadota bacterium]